MAGAQTAVAVENDTVKGNMKINFCGFRYLIATMGSVGMAIIYGSKVNLSVAIVAMVNKTAVNILTDPVELRPSDACDFNEDQTLNGSEDGPFVWDQSLQGYILSAYFCGYALSLMPGGQLAERTSAKWVMFTAVSMNAVASILSPLAAETHPTLFMIIRFIQGLGGGLSLPAMHVMISKWSPPKERTSFVSIVYAGTVFGTVLSISFSGEVAQSLGWEWIFYIQGILCLIWCAVWWPVIQDSPDAQKRWITQTEKDLILKSLGQNNSGSRVTKKPPVPWRCIFASKPFWAILLSHFYNNFGWYMMLIELPTYMDRILKFDIAENANLSSLPYFSMWIFTLGFNKCLKHLQKKKKITPTLSRKLATTISCVVPSCALMGIAFVGCNRYLVVGLLVIGVTGAGAMYNGILANHIDLAPNYAGTLVAITNTVATIPGFLVPIFVGKFTEINPTPEAWHIVFLVAILFYIIELVIYLIFGSALEQPWNKLPVEGCENMLALYDKKKNTVSYIPIIRCIKNDNKKKEEGDKKGENRSENDNNRSESGETRNENDNNRSENGESGTENDKNRSENGEARNETGKNQSENGETRNEAGENRSENGEPSSENGKTRNETGENPSENGKTRNETGENSSKNEETRSEKEETRNENRNNRNGSE